jgi:hypothetical protein
MLMAFFFVVAVTLVPFLLGLLERYLEQLPDAPLCPGCRALTRGPDCTGWAALLLPGFSHTVMRECADCGWWGRMRLRVAPEGARRL